jgi:archaellum component FlaG (FlaF/FlaG flagellin family)
MGFSLTGTHVVFFITAVIVAGAVSGVLMAVSVNVTTSLSERGDRVREQLDTEFVIINDNENIPSDSGFYQFYLKNIGGATLITTEDIFQVFIDGDIVETSYYNFSTTSIKIGEVATLNIATSMISSGDHTLRIVGPLAIDEEFIFTI